MIPAPAFVFSFLNLFILMPTFPSPVTVSEFQTYIKDTTTDPAIVAFYQTLLDTATEKVYTYLDRDYTAGAVKTDVFFGKGLHVHRMQNPAGTFLSWKYYDEKGAETVGDVLSLVILAEGNVAVSPEDRFRQGFEHRLKYQQPLILTCPETVKQVITEVAAIIFQESNQGSGSLGVIITSERNDTNSDRLRYSDLTERQKAMLAPYKRYAV
jgi:hypothetical protein